MPTLFARAGPSDRLLAQPSGLFFRPLQPTHVTRKHP